MRKILFTLLAALALTGCNAQTTKKETNMSKKALVVFFSHAGENYNVGVIEEGTNADVATWLKNIGLAE